MTIVLGSVKFSTTFFLEDYNLSYIDGNLTFGILLREHKGNLGLKDQVMAIN